MLFIAGGQCGEYGWASDVHIYDIENGTHYDIKDKDKALKTIPA